MAKRKIKRFLLKTAMYACSLLTVAVLIFIIGYIFVKGLPFVSGELLTTQSSYINGTVGILPNILNTLYIIFVSMIIALPLGVGAAVYLTEYASNKKAVSAITFASETLGGLPSILFGLAGMFMFTRLLGLKPGVLAGSLTLVMIVLPTIMNNTVESLKTVPQSLREGALALGCGKWHMIRTVVLPNALSGILTGSILAVGRIVGESAALLFTAGFGMKLLSFADALQSSSATLSVALYIYASEEGRYDVAFAITVVLIAVSVALNLCAALVEEISERKKGSNG